MRLIPLAQFSSALLLFDNLAYTKYILPKQSDDEAYIKHHKNSLTRGCKIFWVKKLKRHA